MVFMYQMSAVIFLFATIAAKQIVSVALCISLIIIMNYALYLMN